MSHYKFSLKDYHAIASANIMLNGITVLSGENGCGKSTLSRWIFYLVNGANEFDSILYQDFLTSLQAELHMLSTVYQDIRMATNVSTPLLIQDGIKKIQDAKSRECQDNIDQTLTIYQNLVDRFGIILTDYIKTSTPKIRRDRSLRFLGIETDGATPLHVRVANFIEEEKQKGEKLLEEYLEAKDKREREEFIPLIKAQFDIREQFPQYINFYEDKVSLLNNGKVGYLYNLKRAIYVDTPMAVSEDVAEDNIFWKNLQNMMIYPMKEKEISISVRKLIYRIQKIINGSVTVVQDDFDEFELHFKRSDGLEIKLDNVATGMKSFSYLLRLLENGYLDSDTILLIDEPEAHLHPQWVVEFAHILVLLHKEIGVKVVIASHHPDMIAAINSISLKENLQDDTTFYIAIPSDMPYQYVYGELGNNVEEIFKSFNIAYQRIEQYGQSSGV